jgi:hypothetical protein
MKEFFRVLKPDGKYLLLSHSPWSDRKDSVIDETDAPFRYEGTLPMAKGRHRFHFHILSKASA